MKVTQAQIQGNDCKGKDQDKGAKKKIYTKVSLIVRYKGSRVFSLSFLISS